MKYEFNVPAHELINIYVIYVRSVVEKSAVVWHSSITKGEQRDTKGGIKNNSERFIHLLP